MLLPTGSVQLVLPLALNLGYLDRNLGYLDRNLLTGFGMWDGCVWLPTFSSEEEDSASPYAVFEQQQQRTFIARESKEEK